MVAWLGLATVAVAYICFGRGLARLDVSSVTTLSLAEPLTAALLGVAVLGETLVTVQVAGAAFVVLGLALSSRGDRPRRG